MKIYYKVLAGLLGCFIIFFVTGCLKDKYSDEGLAGFTINSSDKIVEIEGPVSGTVPYSSTNTISLSSSAKDTTFSLITIQVANDQPVSQDVQVTLKMDSTLVTAYNDTTGNGYKLPSSGLYRFSNLTVTIVKGSREGYLQMTTKPAELASGDYAFGFRIVSVSDPSYKISGNFNNQVVIVGVKNKYDGHYTVTGTFFDKSNAAFTGRYPMDIYLITTGANSVVMYDNVIGTQAHSFNNAGSTSYYGSFAPVFTFDASDNVLNVVNYYGQPAGNGRSGSLDAGTNKWNAGNRSIDVNYFMLQPTVATPYRTSFQEHFTYVGPRP